MEGSSSSNTRGDQRLPEITPPPFVMDTVFQHGIHEDVINVRFPNVANAMPASEHGVPNPQGDGLSQDRAARRREKSRGYSKAYRQRKNARTQNLEEKQNILTKIISEEPPRTQLYKGIASVLKDERKTLQETLSIVNSNGEVQNAEMYRIQYEIEQLKLTKDGK